MKKIYISKELKEALEKICETSEVAQKLLIGEFDESELVENHVNYLSLSKDDPSKISYLTQDRLETILSKGEDIWTSSRRYHSKAGSFVGRLFSRVSSREIEKFANLIKSNTLSGKFKFSIVHGSSIKYYYSEESYRSNESGSLGASCMRHESCSDFFNIYIQNGIKMLIMLDNNDMLLGRALLWETETHKIMDRIYTYCDEEYSHHFKTWANANGYLYKREQKWNNTMEFISNGKHETIKTRIKLDSCKYSHYPYLDTFKWLDIDNGYLYNYKPESGRVRVLNCGEGSYYDSNYLTYDDYEKVWHKTEEMRWVKYPNIHTHESNVVWSESNDCYILEKDAKYLDSFDDYVYKDWELNSDYIKNEVEI